MTARCQGGNNAGHTVKTDTGTFDFHILPSGVINARCLNVIGNGVVMNLESFEKEIRDNKIDMMKGWESRIFISERAHIVLDVHRLVGIIAKSSRIADIAYNCRWMACRRVVCKARKGEVLMHTSAIIR